MRKKLLELLELLTSSKKEKFYDQLDAQRLFNPLRKHNNNQSISYYIQQRNATPESEEA